MADRTARILIGVDTDTATAEKGFADVGVAIDRLEQKVDAATAGGKADKLGNLPEPLRQSFLRAELAAADFNRRLEIGAVTGPRDLRKVTIAQTLLNQEIEKSGLSLDKLGPEAKAAYGKLEAAQKQAIVTTSRIKEELDDVNVQTTTGTRGFTGFGDAVESMGGRAGAAAEKLGFVAAAFTAGVAAGQQFNQFAKTDMSEWNDQVELVGMRFKAAFAGIADVLVGVGEGFAAVLKGDVEGASRALSNISDGFHGVADSVSKTNDELRHERDELKNAAAEAAALVDAQKKAEEEAKRFAESQKKIADETRKLNEALKEQQALMQTAQIDASDNRAQGQENADQLRNTEANMRMVEQAIDAMRAKLTQQTEDFGADSAAVARSRQELEQLDDQLAMLTQRQSTLSKSLADHQAAEEAATATAKRAEEQAKALAKQKADLAKEVENLAGVTEEESLWTNTVTGAVERYRSEVVAETMGVKESFDAGESRVKLKQRLVKITDEEAAATDKEADAQKKAATVVNETTAALKGLADIKMDAPKTELLGLKQIVDQLAESVRTVTKDMQKLSRAGSDDDDDGIDIRRSDPTKTGKLGGGNLKETPVA